LNFVHVACGFINLKKKKKNSENGVIYAKILICKIFGFSNINFVVTIISNFSKKEKANK